MHKQWAMLFLRIGLCTVLLGALIGTECRNPCAAVAGVLGIGSGLSPSSTGTAAGVVALPEALAFTGVSSGQIAWLGLALLALGLAVLIIRRQWKQRRLNAI